MLYKASLWLGIGEVLHECYTKLPTEPGIEEVLFKCDIRPPHEPGIGEVLFKVGVI